MLSNYAQISILACVSVSFKDCNKACNNNSVFGFLINDPKIIHFEKTNIFIIVTFSFFLVYFLIIFFCYSQDNAIIIFYNFFFKIHDFLLLNKWAQRDHILRSHRTEPENLEVNKNICF
jgi:hypothetical protein